MSDDIPERIRQLEETLKLDLPQAARESIERDLAALRGQQATTTSGDITVSGVQGQGVAAGHGAQATVQKQEAGRDLINSPQIINLGTLVYGRDTSEDERRQLVWYLRSLTNTLEQLPLQGIETRLDQQGQGISLSGVYTMLATHTMVIREVFEEAPLEKLDVEKFIQEHDPDKVLPDQARIALAVGNKKRDAEWTPEIKEPLGGLFHIHDDNLSEEIQASERVECHGSLLATEAVQQQQRLVLLGDPGSGKSTFVRHLALTLARRELGESVDDHTLPNGFTARLPLILPLQKLARRVAAEGCTHTTVFDALAAEMEDQRIEQVPNLLHAALHQGRALLLFDGLDEVPVEAAADRASRLETVQAVRAFAQQYQQVPVVVTCRVRAFTADLRECLDWPVETLAPFTLGQVRHFVPAWYAELAAKTSLTPETAQRYTTRLVERVAASRQLSEMAGTPLLLTMMALVLYNKGDLPRDRPQLYEDILDLLLGRWDAVQEKGGHTLAEYIGLPEWDSQRLLPLLDRLSYEAHRTAASADGRGRLAKTTVRDTLIAFFEQAGLSEKAAFEKAGCCIDYIQQRSGLLMPDGDESYVFAHLTLQEHCAGRYIVLGSEDPARLVLEHRADDRWREPIMLGLGLAPPADLDDVLEALWERDEAGQPKPDERWYRDLVLAAEIGEDREWSYLQTLPRIKVAKHQEKLRLGLAVLLTDQQPPLPYTERVHAGFLLGDLGHDPRLLDLATGTSPDGRYWCRVEAGTFWYGDDRPRSDDEKKLSPEEYEPKRLAKLKQVHLPYDFLIARYPVTNAEYARFIAAGGYAQQAWWTKNGWGWKGKAITLPRRWDDSRFNNSTQPVVGVSWYEAAAYCRWLTQQGHMQGWLDPEQVIRLPTSLEWERAARHTDQRPYPWGWEEPTPERANYQDTGIGRPSPVGCFPAGAAVCGAQDMAGNVLEWLATPNEQREQVEPEKDVPPDEFVMLTRSAYFLEKDELLCGSRIDFIPSGGNDNLGFRVIQSLRSSD